MLLACVTMSLAIQFADGTPEGNCYGNNTCNAQLECIDGKCKPASGTTGGTCREGDKCDSGLRCERGLCTDAPPPAGTSGGACYGNNTCNDGLACTAGSCSPNVVVPAAELPSKPPPADGKIRVLVLDLEAVDIQASQTALLNGSVAGALNKIAALEVLTTDDLKRLADVEADRQALGCETSSCLAELAGAVGTRYVVYGKVGKLGALWVVQLNVFDSEQTKPIGREEVQAATVESLPQRLAVAAAELVRGLVPTVAAGPPLAKQADAYQRMREARSGRVLAPVGAAVTTGGIALVSTGAAFVLADFFSPVLPFGYFGYREALAITMASGAGVATTFVGGAVWGAGAIVNGDLRAEDEAIRAALAGAADRKLLPLYELAESDHDFGESVRLTGVGSAVTGLIMVIGSVAMLATTDFTEYDSFGLPVGTRDMRAEDLAPLIVSSAVTVGGGALATWGFLRRESEERASDAVVQTLQTGVITPEQMSLLEERLKSSTGKQREQMIKAMEN